MGKRKARKNANGAGSTPVLRKDGRWMSMYYFMDEYGIKKRGSVYGKTKAECQRKLNHKLVSLDEAYGIQKSEKNARKYTVTSWLEEWLDTYCRELKPSTLAGYRSKCRYTIIPIIGNQPLDALDNIKIQKFINHLKNGDAKQKPLSPKSIQNIHGILHRGLEQAVEIGLLNRNPCDHVKLPKVGRPDLHPLMDDDIPRFLEAIKGNFYESLFCFALFSGMRMSEIMGLRWENVDLERGYITVCEQIQKNHEGPGFIHISSTKNGKSRIVVINSSLVELLSKQKEIQEEWKQIAASQWCETGLVFTDTFGRNVSNTTIQHMFKRIVSSMGRPDCRFHDLRHSYAINALQIGISVKDVQEQLGHYSSSFTMDVYTQRSETMRKASQDKMEEFWKSILPSENE